MDGPPRSFEQLQVDAKILDSCQCEVYLVRVLECFPGLSDLLTIITVITVSVLLLGPYHSSKIVAFITNIRTLVNTYEENKNETLQQMSTEIKENFLSKLHDYKQRSRHG